MLGWEFPPILHGGLGVACEGLGRALSKNARLTFILPKGESTSLNENLRLIGLNQADHSGKDSGKMEAFSVVEHVPSDLRPYLDAETFSMDPADLYGPDLGAKVIAFAQKVTHASRHHDFDIIHAHDWMTALAGLEVRKQTGKPLVFHTHSLTYDRAGPAERGWIYEIEKNILKSADLVIAVSHYCRQICLDHYEAPPEKVVVVHNGASPVRSFRSSKPFPEKLVVFLGRVTGQKGPGHFLKIAQKVLSSESNVRFAVAGTGEQLHPLMAGAVRLGIQKKFHFTGFLNRKKIHRLLSMADAYCMPSVSEPFGLSALEAAQFGVPAVLSKQSGVAEILPSARTADSWDTDAMAAHLIEILSKKGDFRPTVVRTWDEAAAETLVCYQGLLSKR
ncbi:MAG: glycogen(starch) synthase [Akkermansiaceae bacterium]|jgi:glycogen(starch) synthase